MTGSTSFIEAPSKPPTLTGCCGFTVSFPSLLLVLNPIPGGRAVPQVHCQVLPHVGPGSLSEHQLGHEARSKTATHKYSEMPRDCSPLQSSGQRGFPHLRSPASVQIELVMKDSLQSLNVLSLSTSHSCGRGTHGLLASETFSFRVFYLIPSTGMKLYGCCYHHVKTP